MDIDRFVLIDNSAFDQIIDNLGGVEITLTAAEARLINQNSGDPSRNLTEGTFNLSGKQAHYYSRIRAIGDDFERTQRQRNVLTSLVNKFKTSNIGTINKALYDCLGLVQTNMTRRSVLSCSKCPDLYELSYGRASCSGRRRILCNPCRCRICVGSPIVRCVRKSLIDFIFEDDRPEMTTD